MSVFFLLPAWYLEQDPEYFSGVGRSKSLPNELFLSSIRFRWWDCVGHDDLIRWVNVILHADSLTLE